MNQQTDLTTMLSLITQPAFYVQGGQIILCNKAAEDLNIHPDTSIAQMIQPEDSQYSQLTAGSLYLTLCHDGYSMDACVSPMGEGTVFVIDDTAASPELKAYALASSQLRQPLSTVITLMSQLEGTLQAAEDPKVQSRALALKHQLWKMHRMLCNMSDAKFYTETTSDRRVCQNATAVVEEIFQKVQDLLQREGITLEYQVPCETVLCLLDEQLLERAVYNMISNAVKFSGSKAGLKAELKQKDNRLSLSITEPCGSVNGEIPANIFRQYTREPGIETGVAGIGLGMSIVCSAAKAHKGTVLLDHPSNHETRITLSFPIDLGQDTKVASGLTGFDYAGGWDRGLLELADILPADFYA